MFCSKCGKKVDENTKFCPGCGEKVESKKVEKVEVAKTTKKEEKAESNGLGIAGMVIGIVSIILSFFLSVFVLILPIVGLILSCVSKGKKAFKITGIITNILAIVIAFIMIIVGAAILGSTIGGIVDDAVNNNQDVINDIKKDVKEKVDEVEKTVKSEYPYGTWTCLPYSSTNLQQYDYDNIMSNSKEDLTVLKLNLDNSFQYGPYVDSYKNYYKGTFTYDIERDKNEQYKSQGFSFIMIKGPITDAMVDGVKQTTTSESGIELEMELWNNYNNDKALIMFTNTYNMYFCER